MTEEEVLEMEAQEEASIVIIVAKKDICLETALKRENPMEVEEAGVEGIDHLNVIIVVKKDIWQETALKKDLAEVEEVEEEVDQWLVLIVVKRDTCQEIVRKVVAGMKIKDHIDHMDNQEDHQVIRMNYDLTRNLCHI